MIYLQYTRALAFAIIFFQLIRSSLQESNYYDDHDDNDDDDAVTEKSEETFFKHKSNPIVSFEKETFIKDIVMDSSIDHDKGSTFTLYLLVLYEPSCKHSDGLIEKLQYAADMLVKDETLLQLILGEENEVPRPVVGRLNVAGPETNVLQSFFGVEETPTLKFVMVEHLGFEEIMQSLSDESDDMDPSIYSLEYVGKDSTGYDIYCTMLHYWYRLIVSESTEYNTMQQLSEFDSIDIVPTKPLFSMPSMEALSTFIDNNGFRMFSTSPQDVLGTSEREEQYIRSLMRYVEPFHAFVQCRSLIDGKIPPPLLAEFKEFDELALNYLYRKDLAFFVVISDSCDWIQENTNNPLSNGAVRMLEISDDTTRQTWSPGAIFDPSSKAIFQPASTDEILVLNMTQFAIIHSTPSILWFDRYTTASIAFPTYREIHFILFVDVHSPRTSDGSFDYTSKSYLKSCLAIALLRETSILHKIRRPFEDVVFMIIPSSEIQIMSTFGIDVWSEIDGECTDESASAGEGECFENSFPSAMITSRRKSSDFMEVYHLSSTDLALDIDNCVIYGLDPHLDDDYYESDSCNGGGSGGDLYQFLDSYFKNTITPTIKSEQLSEHHIKQNYTLSSGVEIATSNTFQEVVLADHKRAKHAIVYFYVPSCGFCKRFDTTWHNVARLVTKMNWNSIISVVKIDISKNDLHIKGVNIQSVPAVYFFGIGRKDLPQRMILEEDADTEEIYSNLGSVVDPTAIMRWVLDMLGEDDLKKMNSLAMDE